MRIHEWFAKKIKSAQWIHHDVKSRIKFRWIYFGVIIGIFAIFLLAVVFFWLSGLRFEAYKQNQPTPGIPYTSGEYIPYLIVGLLLFLIGVILAILIGGIYYPLLFKKSQDLYMQTKQFKQKVLKYEKVDLAQFNLKELKWFKRLQWINKVEFNVAKTKIKNKQKLEKK